MNSPWPETRYFTGEGRRLDIALDLYRSVKEDPLVCPHGHVDPGLFADPDRGFGTPVDLLVLPDHYLQRMLHSQGVSYEALGLRPQSAEVPATPVESDHRKIWNLVFGHRGLFRGTPTGIWLREVVAGVFGAGESWDQGDGDGVYDRISAHLADPTFQPRGLYERFHIEVLCTTDPAWDSLESHDRIRRSGWEAHILPTFRPDGVVNLDDPGWPQNLRALETAWGREIGSCRDLIRALEDRRAFFRSRGAISADHGAPTAYTGRLEPSEAEEIFRKALGEGVTDAEARLFTGHLLWESARMSCEDGLVMQLHSGSLRNHDGPLFRRFGPDRGADLPLGAEFTKNLRPLLESFGSHPRFKLILFTLDEGAYARELAPLAGYYPSVLLGPPWWFHDSWNGMGRYFDQVMETAGLANTVGFNDDTRAFCSIPVRHDLWRRASADWLAGLVARSVIGPRDAREMMKDLAVGLARRAYNWEMPEGDRA